MPKVINAGYLGEDGDDMEDGESCRHNYHPVFVIVNRIILITWPQSSTSLSHPHQNDNNDNDNVVIIIAWVFTIPHSQSSPE